MLFVLLLLLPVLRTQGVVPANRLEPAKSLQFDTVNFLKRVKPNKNGPILFPDGPPPPPTPLVVTSRPLIESIRRSELNPNNTIQDSSLFNQLASKQFRKADIFPRPIFVPDNFQYGPYKVSPQMLLRSEKDEYVQGSSSYPLIYRGLQEYANSIYGQNNILEHSTAIPYNEHRDTSTDYATVFINKHTGRDPPQYHNQQTPTVSPTYATYSNQPNTVLYQQRGQETPPRQKPVFEYQKNPPEYRNYNQGSNEQTNSEHSSGDNYAFSYAVGDRQTGDDFSHKQTSRGTATNGEYRVRLPDGRTQIVSYTADEGGYKADVRYDDDHDHGHDDSTENNNIKQNYRSEDFNNQYTNNPYIVNDSKDSKHSGHRNNNINNAHLYADHIDNTVPPHTIYSKVPQQDLYKNLNYYETNKNFNNHDFNDKISEPKLGDYDRFSSEGVSSEYKDYSSENVDYLPYTSKYTAFNERNADKIVKSTVIPPYESVNNMFVTPDPHYLFIPRPQAKPIKTVSENVVTIGNKKPGLYTNIRNVVNDITVSPTPVSYTTAAPSVVSPRNFLISTIANLRSKFNLNEKPLLSQAYIDKLSNYLNFKL